MQKLTLTEKLNTLHKWSDRKLMRYEGKDVIFGMTEVAEFEARECTICHAIDKGYGTLYNACDITMIYPASTNPCLCTGRQYAEAHGLEYNLAKEYDA